MKIPISNTLYPEKNKFIKEKKINIKTLNKMNFQHVDAKKFPSVLGFLLLLVLLNHLVGGGAVL